MNKNIFIVGSLAIVLGAGSYWFNTKAVAVTVISPEQTRLQVTILATGQVQTRTATTINTEIAGIVKSLVDEGQTVNTGDILATIDDKDADSLYQQAAANLKSAELKLDHLRHIDRPQASLKAQQSLVLLQQSLKQNKPPKKP
jgi:multidrug efflux pump subunit AcrA (membrane-fusion protein)